MRLRLFVLSLVLALGCAPAPAGDDGGGGGGAGGSGGSGGAGGSAGAGGSGGSGGSGGGAADAGVTTTVRIHYPAGARGIAIRGSRAPLNWGTGVGLSPGTDDTFTFTVTDLSGELEFKPLVDDVTWSRGPNYKVQPGQTADVFPRFYTVNGTWSRRWPAVASALLGNSRGVWVYLPPTYAENTRARFPVVYMHDGQNLFDPAAAFGGNPWRVQDALDVGAEDGTIREAIVVGPESSADRIGEYTPSNDPAFPGSGKGDLYLRFLVEELKPKADAELRTLPGREHTLVLGSSLGGLISSYAGVKKPLVFGYVGAMSPSTWWDNLMIVGVVGTTGAAPARPLKIYVDVGTSSDGQAETAQLASAYRGVGYVDGTTLLYVVDPGASHNETYWRQRLPGALRFLLGPGR
jgi:predicted alpha/beta superfamily hydrolase